MSRARVFVPEGWWPGV